MPFRIEYSPDAVDHLRTVRAADPNRVVDAVDEHLVHEPETETTHRKLLRPNPLAPRELRVGDLRVFYDVHRDERLVTVLAVGVKDRNILRIAGEEFTL